MAQRILSIFGVKDTRLLPEAIMQAVMNPNEEEHQFLRGFFLQNGDNYFGSWFWSNSIDVMVLASHHLAIRRHEMENFKLATVAKFMGINVDDEALHDAFYDIYLTREIYKLMLV